MRLPTTISKLLTVCKLSIYCFAVKILLPEPILVRRPSPVLCLWDGQSLYSQLCHISPRDAPLLELQELIIKAERKLSPAALQRREKIAARHSMLCS